MDESVYQFEVHRVDGKNLPLDKAAAIHQHPTLEPKVPVGDEHQQTRILAIDSHRGIVVIIHCTALYSSWALKMATMRLCLVIYYVA